MARITLFLATLLDNSLLRHSICRIEMDFLAIDAAIPALGPCENCNSSGVLDGPGMLPPIGGPKCPHKESFLAQNHLYLPD